MFRGYKLQYSPWIDWSGNVNVSKSTGPNPGDGTLNSFSLDYCKYSRVANILFFEIRISSINITGGTAILQAILPINSQRSISMWGYSNKSDKTASLTLIAGSNIMRFGDGTTESWSPTSDGIFMANFFYEM